MTSPLTSARFAIVPIIADSRGNEVVPANAIVVGSRNSVMEHVMDSKARNDALALRADAVHIRARDASLREREEAVAAREDTVNSVVRAQQMQDFINKMDALSARIDQLEREQAELAHDPDDDFLPVPPGSPGSLPTSDDGELESPKEAPGADTGELESPKVAPSEDPDQPRSPVAAEDA